MMPDPRNHKRDLAIIYGTAFVLFLVVWIYYEAYVHRWF